MFDRRWLQKRAEGRWRAGKKVKQPRKMNDWVQ
jgi:hypothetical protein